MTAIPLRIFPGEMIQLFGYHDAYNESKEVADFVEDYADRRGIEIMCPILKKPRKK